MTQVLTDVIVSVLMDSLIGTSIVMVPLIIAFYMGRWMGIKKVMGAIQKEMEGIKTIDRKNYCKKRGSGGGLSWIYRGEVYLTFFPFL